MASLSPTDEQTRLAVTIDRYVHTVVAGGGGDEELLASAVDHMGTFKQLLDTCSAEEMDTLCDRYDGFFHFAQLMEALAEGLADGRISVPK